MRCQQRLLEGEMAAAVAAEWLDSLSCFTCPVCLEVFKSPVKVPCDQAFKECLKPKEPVCGVCHSTLPHGSRALESFCQSSEPVWCSG
uniref:Uncharacterized protein n=1 Tax=Podarcis muralis TaxID=64176 RepID=A0A670I8Z4_PODMU